MGKALILWAAWSTLEIRGPVLAATSLPNRL